MIKTVSSANNETLKMIRSLSRKKGRIKNNAYFAEGVRIVDDALKSANIRMVVASDVYAEKNPDFVKSVDKIVKNVYITDEKIFRELCMTENPQGIGAVIDIPSDSEVNFDGMNYVLILDSVSEPGNMGTIIRTAEAAGIERIFLTDGCADIYNPKTVRAAMGSLVRMKFSHCDDETVRRLHDVGFKIVATALYNSVSIENVDIHGKRALVIGNEAHGVSDKIIGLSDFSVRIDMCGRVESLNAAVAAGISMYMLRPKQGEINA